MKNFLKLLFVSFLLLAVSGCGNAAGESSARTRDVKSIYQSISQINKAAEAREIDDFAIENDFGLSLEDIEEYAGSISNNMKDPALTLIIQAKEGKGNTVRSALETYKQNQIVYFGNYPEFSEALSRVKDGRIHQSGDLVIMVFSSTDLSDYGEIDRLISELVK